MGEVSVWTVPPSIEVPTEVANALGVITRKRISTCSVTRLVPKCLPQVTYTFPFSGETVRWLSCTKSLELPVPRVDPNTTGAVQVERLFVHLAIRMAVAGVLQEKRVHTT